MCLPYQNALAALWAKMDASSNTPSFVLPIAACKAIEASEVAEASNNGLVLNKLVENWSGRSLSGTSCGYSSYGVFDSATGEKKMTTDSLTGAQIPLTAQEMYQNYFTGCDASSDVAPFINMGTDSGCPSAIFTPQCANPAEVSFAQCKNPGWDYMDTDSDGWAYSTNTSCTGESFTGAEYADRMNTAEAINCTDQCCVYASTTLDSTIGGCTSCGAQGSNEASSYYQDWSGASQNKAPYVKITGIGGNGNPTEITLPYCNDATVSSGRNHQGVAVSLNNGDSNPNLAKFGDPRECHGDGLFSGQCRGLTGCDGLWSGGLIESADPCRLGFSASDSPNPSTNCPNIYTLQNSGADNNCVNTVQDNTICNPHASVQGGNCNDPKVNNQHLVTDAGYPRVTEIEIPEGAWVTVYDNGQSFSTTDAPNQTMVQLCNPSTFPENGVKAWTYACGRNTNGNLQGQSKSMKIKPSGSWVTGDDTSMDETCVNTQGTVTELQGQICSHIGITDTAYNTDGTMNSCRFHTNSENPMYGWSFGFMPGYYNTTCTTNYNNNECGNTS